MNNSRQMSYLSMAIKKKKKVISEIIGKRVENPPKHFFVALYKFTVCPCLEDYLRRVR